MNIGGQVNISFTNPADTTVNLASLSWIDANGDSQSAVEYPDTNTVVEGDPVTISLDTSTEADLTAQLYLRGEDTYGRGVSLVWQYWKQSSSASADEVTAINEIFRSLEGLYATSKPSDNEIMKAWFDNNAAPEYLHDGRDRDIDREVWTGPGGFYEGLSISAIILEPNVNDNWGNYQKGYWIRLDFSGSGRSGSILTSMVYDGTRWLWYGNRDWGLGLYGFLPWAEKTVSGETDPAFDTGFEVIIWDTYLYAYKYAKSAIITGPGLGDGLKLAHCYNEVSASDATYFSLAAVDQATCSGTATKSLSD